MSKKQKKGGLIVRNVFPFFIVRNGVCKTSGKKQNWTGYV